MRDDPNKLTPAQLEAELARLQGVEGDTAEDRRRAVEGEQHDRANPPAQDDEGSVYF